MEVSVKLSNLKPLHARWFVEMFDYLKQQNESIVNGFDKAGITEAVKLANEVFSKIETLLLRNEKITNNCKFHDSLLFTEKKYSSNAFQTYAFNLFLNTY